MKIHEYQARELFEQYGIPTGGGVVAGTAAEAEAAARKMGGPVVVKAQVLVGGRGKAGGVKVAKSPAEAAKAASEILALTIKGIPVEKVMIVPAAHIRQEYYVGIITDRSSKNLTLMMTGEGGMEIEELAVTNPDAILRVPLEPHRGFDREAVTAAAVKVFSDSSQAEQAVETIDRLYQLFLDKDCSLVEINPYAAVDEGRLLALDAKINFDDNALMKHPDIAVLQSREEYSSDEIKAREMGLSFVSMDGDIGCIVNGAGLAMATMDVIKLFGAEPANFLDVGGSSNPAKMVNALSIILGNPKVKAVLVNIFGGITRCDDIANGILEARKQIDIKVPMVIRLVGTNDTEGRRILAGAGLSAMETMTEAVKKVVALAKGD
jgi:succinyl-CoA synthetase beta subunit